MSFLDTFKLSDVALEAAKRVEARNQKASDSQRIEVDPRRLDKRDNLLLLHYLGQTGAVTKNRQCRVQVRNKAVVIRYGAEA